MAAYKLFCKESYYNMASLRLAFLDWNLAGSSLNLPSNYTSLSTTSWASPRKRKKEDSVNDSTIKTDSVPDKFTNVFISVICYNKINWKEKTRFQESQSKEYYEWMGNEVVLFLP